MSKDQPQSSAGSEPAAWQYFGGGEWHTFAKPTREVLEFWTKPESEGGMGSKVRPLFTREPQPVLDWLATKTNYEISYSGWDNEDPTWDVHSVNGGRNDREWTLLATGSTPEEALRKAMSLSLTRPQSEAGQ